MTPRTGPRRLPLACLAAGLLVACASPGVPPGGPEDIDAPALVRVRPDTDDVNVRAGSIGFDFDDVISERPQGGSSLADLFIISPSRGRAALSWRRTRVEVRPREGFRPNTTYRVTLLPGLVDLSGNVDTVGHTLVFSTGPRIDTGVISGRVFDWMEARAARDAWVEAIVLPDSLRYLTLADSLGAFTLRNLPPGSYVLRSMVDVVKNRTLDPREIFDTVTVALRDSAVRALHLIARDTLGPAIQQVEVVDTLTIRVRFDHALDTALAIATEQFSVRDARDSTAVPIARALGARVVRRLAEDSLRTKAREDSIRAANDTTRRDSAAVARPRPAPRPAPGGRPAAPRDTTPPPRPTVRLPEVEVVITLQGPLRENAPFVVRAEGMRTIVGRTRSSERRFTTPRARRDSTRRDTSATRRDTGTVRRDTATVRRETTGRSP